MIDVDAGKAKRKPRGRTRSILGKSRYYRELMHIINEISRTNFSPAVQRECYCLSVSTDISNICVDLKYYDGLEKSVVGGVFTSAESLA